MAKLRLTLACWNYDRTRALLEERISVDGIELNYLNLVVEETFFRMLRHREFDVAEMSLSSYTISLFGEDPPFIAIPVFPSRSFRHSCIYVNADSGIREPKDLIGKRIGNPEYQMTAPVWIRGILSDEYGVPVTSATYFQGGEEEPGRPEKLPLKLPPEIQVRSIPLDRTLSAMIVSGEIDALYATRAPSTFKTAPDRVRRLLENYPAAEHLFGSLRMPDQPRKHDLQRGCFAQVFIGFTLCETAALKVMLPWLVWHTEETEKMLGRDFWPYGLEPNLHNLSTFLRMPDQP